MTTLPDFDIRRGSEYSQAIARPENLGVLRAFEYLDTPRDFREDGLGPLGGCRPWPDRYHCHIVRLEILRHIERGLVETGIAGTVGGIKVVGDDAIIGKRSPQAPHLPRSRDVPHSSREER